MQNDHGRSVGVAAGTHGEGAGPKVCGLPLAQLRRGLEVLIVPWSEDPAAPAPSRAPSPSRKKAPQKKKQEEVGFFGCLMFLVNHSFLAFDLWRKVKFFEKKNLALLGKASVKISR